MISCVRATRTIKRVLVGHAQWETIYSALKGEDKRAVSLDVRNVDHTSRLV